MKCTSCGLPLSPARTMTSCPRCGTPIVSEKKSSSSPGQRPFPQVETWKSAAGQAELSEVVRSPMRRPGPERHDEPGPHGVDAFHPAGAHVHAPVTFPPAAPMYTPQPTPEPEQGWPTVPASQGDNGSNLQQLPVQEYGFAGLGSAQTDGKHEEGALKRSSPALAPHQGWQPRGGNADRPAVGGVVIGAPRATLHRPLRGRNNNFGFLVAGLCVLMGGLILFLIYFMALGAPGNSNGTGAANTRSASNTSPIAASSPVSSPTATPFPGQRYIDHAQLASRVDAASRQPIQLTTTFKVNQTIYVTFQLHPAGQNGAVCLFWYANNRQFAMYQLQVVANEQLSYSYATYRGTGSGYVELYWASTTRCTDKVLAQHVNFTVTA